MKGLTKVWIKKAVSVLVVVCFMLSIANIPAYSYMQVSQTQCSPESELQRDFFLVSQVGIETPLQQSNSQTQVVAATSQQTKTATKKASKASVNKVVKQALSLINKLLKNKKLSKTAQKWLKAAKKKVNKLLNTTNMTAAKEALSLIKAVKKAKCSSLSLVKATVTGSVFKSLKSVLNKDKNYKLYRKYVEKAVKAIDSLLKRNITSEAKKWLNQAKTLIMKKMFGKESLSSRTKWLKKALSSINYIVKQNASNESLRTQSAQGKVFASLNKIIPADKVNPAPAPVDPVNPVDPVDPVNPVDPVDPVNPVDPVDPVNPVDPVDPTPVEKPYQQNLDASTALINNLKNNENTSNLAKSWLDAAQTTINEIANSDKDDAEKEELIANALASIQNVSNNNCSMEVLEQESANGVFSSLQTTVLEKNTEYQNYQINNTYSAENVEVINSLTATSGLSKYQVFQQFKNAGVTDEKFAEVAATLTDKINGGETFTNTSTVALAKYLNLNEKLVAVQQLAVAIANGSDLNNNLSGNDKSVSLEDQLAVIKLNGNNAADIYSYTLDDFMSTLKNGETAIVYNYYNSELKRTITVTKQNENSYVVVDSASFLTLQYPNGTSKNVPVQQTYTAEQFRQAMSNKKVDVSVSVPEANWSSTWRLTHNAINSDDKIRFISNSKGVKEVEETRLNTEYVEPANEIINNLLNTEGTSDLAKQWLNKAKEILNGIINENDNVSNEEVQLKEVLASIERVARQNASTAVLLSESINDSVFASLQEEVLNKDENVKNVIYPIFERQAKSIISTVKNLLNNSEFGDSEQVAFNGIYNLIGNVANEIINIVNSGNGDYSAQQQWLQAAAASVENIQNENFSMVVLDQETQEGSIFAPIRESLENIIQKYEQAGAAVIRALAKYVELAENLVFQQFVKFDVSLANLQHATASIWQRIQDGSNFLNCASVAVSKYLEISRALAAIQNAAADISLGYSLGTDSQNVVSTTSTAEIKVLRANGHENTTEIRFETINKFMDALNVGEKAIFYVECYGLGGHAIMVKREANGWGVFDINRNKGEEVIYTPENFIALMTGTNGATVQGVTEKGETFNSKIYYTAMTSNGVCVITDAIDAIALAA